MESEIRVHWGTTFLDGPTVHPNCDPSFSRRATLSEVRDLMPFEYEKVVAIRAKDANRRARVSGDIWVDNESEQRKVHRFLKGQQGRPIDSVLKDLSVWLKSRAKH